MIIQKRKCILAKGITQVNNLSLLKLMKHIFILLFCLGAISAHAQVLVSRQSGENKLSIGQVLINKDYETNRKSTIKLLTEEESVQVHDGKEVYKTIQEVEYTIKSKGTRISTKRKILNSKKESLCPEGHAEKVFPNVTTNLLSSVLMPHTVNLDGQSSMLPFTMITDSDGLSSLYIDKLAIMKSQGKDTHVMGADIQLVQVSEKLKYKESGNKLYIDSLVSIKSTYSIVSKEKSGDTHQVEVKENITVKDLTKLE